MNDEERYEGLCETLDRLEEMAPEHVILVEGLKDVRALKNIGIDGEIFCVQSGGGPVRAAEHVWRSGKKALIMTDWDRRGNSLADQLRENLSSLGVGYDDRVRSDLRHFSGVFSKDIESLDSVFGLLERRQQ